VLHDDAFRRELLPDQKLGDGAGLGYFHLLPVGYHSVVHFAGYSLRRKGMLPSLSRPLHNPSAG
jgi:hypothetical protein